MKQMIYHFTAPNGFPSSCGVVLVDGPDQKTWVILSELYCNKGMSITNAAERIITDLLTTFNLSADSVRWWEHYPHETSIRGATLDEVICLWDVGAKKYRSPSWRPASHEDRCWVAANTCLTLDGTEEVCRAGSSLSH